MLSTKEHNRGIEWGKLSLAVEGLEASKGRNRTNVGKIGELHKKTEGVPKRGKGKRIHPDRHKAIEDIQQRSLGSELDRKPEGGPPKKKLVK